ncbi:hypothetical protein RRG08_013826 [Elysia crispata]|uniref:Uncharacterized protein n=1 Tax=Elysia crispata TaxID=231223 RepID=A0AAE1BBH1_9GAST|nr:hypothetical protein RRG08_013826 [Elysia crispata]
MFHWNLWTYEIPNGSLEPAQALQIKVHRVSTLFLLSSLESYSTCTPSIHFDALFLPLAFFSLQWFLTYAEGSPPFASFFKVFSTCSPLPKSLRECHWLT